MLSTLYFPLLILVDQHAKSIDYSYMVVECNPTRNDLKELELVYDVDIKNQLPSLFAISAEEEMGKTWVG